MANKLHRTGFFLLGSSLGIALIISSLLFTDTLKFIKSGNQTIRVKGYAEKNIESDLARWTMSISSFSSNQEWAYQEIESHRKIVLDYLKVNGITEDMIDVASITTQKYEEYIGNTYRSTGKVLSYKLVQNITVESKDVYMIEDISSKSTELLKSGIKFESFAPNYLYTRLNSKKIDMLELASKDAYTRATKMAENSGSKIGRLASATQGVFQITGRNSNEIDDYGVNDTYSIQKTIKAVVTMEYTIE
jgi:hypothetical protein